MTQLLATAHPQLARALARSMIHTPPRFSVAEIRIETVMVAMRDGTKLATDVYLPADLPAPSIALRTPYSRGADGLVNVLFTFARRGFVAISQDCRGTGDSEPDSWDYYMYEPEDGYDFVDWITKQSWFDGFIGSCGGSYVGQTQWHMAMHPAMSTIVPDASGLGIAVNTVSHHMFSNAYARSVGKGDSKVPISYVDLEAQMLKETLATGFYNEPVDKPLPDGLFEGFPQLKTLTPFRRKRWLWEYYCSLTCDERANFVKGLLGAKNVTVLEVDALSEVFGKTISHDAHTLPHPDPSELAKSFHAPVLLRTGWYDWGLNDALATWDLLMQSAPEPVRSRCRLFIGPNAHNMPGYHEGMVEHPELHHAYAVSTNLEMLLRWYAAVQEDAVDSWPKVIYYLMGANEWRTADGWPVPGARELNLYLSAGESLTVAPPEEHEAPDRYVYDPNDPTPTVGGSIVSYVYPPGSVDVREVQRRSDVLVYTTQIFDRDLDVVGPLRCVLYASSSAVDTDFVVRLSDVFPDGRAIQLQNGVLRARYRNLDRDPQLLEPNRVYRFEIDMWATANRFKAGHRLRLDISSADFPRFDRNSNRGGEAGQPITALQTIYHDAQHPSQLVLHVTRG